MRKLINWIGLALSENGTPSSKRLFGFMFVLTICGTVIYKVHMAKDLPTYIYYPALAMIALLAGVATVPQLMQIWKGTPPPAENKPE